MADILWGCHVRGPDDVHAAPDYATALRWADVLAELDRKALAMDGSDVPLLNAVPAIWPHSCEAHAADLPKSLEYFSPPADKAGGP